MSEQRRRPAAGRGRTGGRPGRASQPAPADALARQRTRLIGVVEPLVNAAGYDLEGLSLKRVGRRHQVRVTVDGDGGLNLDKVATLSREISVALDTAEESAGELVAGQYELEVSSPGVDRPLTLPRHWRRNVGRLVKVTAAGASVTGRIVAADDDGVDFDSDGQPRRLAYSDLGPGRVQIEFNRLSELGAGAELDDDADDEIGELDEIDDEEGDDGE
jgi:ribosome maturation factor RimP